MFDLVLKKNVNTKLHEIYRTLWAYKIKFKDGGLIFDKLNPRWCVKGGTMDRDLFKSYAEMMRLTSLNIMWGIKSEFYNELSSVLIDLKDAFQSTSTVEPDGFLKEGERELYTEQAPGFKRYGPNGEELVCRQKCYMQGRIDATAGFDKPIMQILTKSAKFAPLLWDPKVLFYNAVATALASIMMVQHPLLRRTLSDRSLTLIFIRLPDHPKRKQEGSAQGDHNLIRR